MSESFEKGKEKRVRPAYIREVIDGGKGNSAPSSEGAEKGRFISDDPKGDQFIFKANDLPVGRKAIENEGMLGSDGGQDDGSHQRFPSDLEDK